MRTPRPKIDELKNYKQFINLYVPLPTVLKFDQLIGNNGNRRRGRRQKVIILLMNKYIREHEKDTHVPAEIEEV